MKKRDIIFICAIIAVATVLLLAVLLMREEGAYVSVRVDGEEIARYSLSRDGEYVLNGGTNVLKVEGGEAWMIEATCPQISGKKCTAQGRIRMAGETITCLPNRLTVTVVSGESEVELEVD